MCAFAKKTTLTALLLLAAVAQAYAHIGSGTVSSFHSGFMHPLSGLDHMTVMVAVGLWGSLKGGKAIWAWPLAFVAVMMLGSMLGMAQMPLPLVEPGILASVVVLGLMVALAIDLPIAAGIAIIGLFALFHGHAHGAEVPKDAGGFEYMAGFALATALLHATGIGVGLGLGLRFRGLARAAGGVCAALGAGLILGMI